MNGRRVKDRRPARRSLVPAVALGLAVALGACSPAGPPEPSSGPTGAPVTVTHSNTPLQTAVAAVVERNLRRRGHAVAPQPEGAPVPAQPWDAAGGRTVAVVDTLTLALTEDPASLLPSVPEPSPRPTTAPTAAGAASTSLPPLDPAAPPRVPADPAAAASPTPLPRGESAPDAAATRGIVEELLAAGGAVSSGVTADGHPHAHGLGVRLERRVGVVGQGVRVDEHLRGGGVPAQADGPHPEPLLHRVQRIVVHEFHGRAGRDAVRVALQRHEIVEDLVEHLRHQGRLLLLQGQAHQPGPGAHLQVERAGTGTPDGPDDHSIRPVELMDMGRRLGHAPILGVGCSPAAPVPAPAVVPAAVVGAPAPPPTGASSDGPSFASQERSPASVFIAQTRGRLGP